MLVTSLVGSAFIGGGVASANSHYSEFYVNSNGTVCDAYIGHYPNLYGYPYGYTTSTYWLPCYATTTSVYWGWDIAMSGLGGASTSAVGWSQGDPYRSDHVLCWAWYQCTGTIQLY
jgi:hypothetical protein